MKIEAVQSLVNVYKSLPAGRRRIDITFLERHTGEPGLGTHHRFPLHFTVVHESANHELYAMGSEEVDYMVSDEEFRLHEAGIPARLLVTAAIAHEELLRSWSTLTEGEPPLVQVSRFADTETGQPMSSDDLLRRAHRLRQQEGIRPLPSFFPVSDQRSA